MTDKTNETDSPRKITLKRKTHTELKVSSAPGQARTVAVEVRKKRTYVKRDPIDVVDESLEIEETALPEIEDSAPEIEIEAAPKAKEAKEPKKTKEVKETKEADKSEKAAAPEKKVATKKAPTKKELKAIEDEKAAAELKKAEEAAEQKMRISQAKERAGEEQQAKLDEAERRKSQEERKRNDEIQKISEAARSAGENTVSKVAITFQGDKKEADKKKEAERRKPTIKPAIKRPEKAPAPKTSTATVAEKSPTSAPSSTAAPSRKAPKDLNELREEGRKSSSKRRERGDDRRSDFYDASDKDSLGGGRRGSKRKRPPQQGHGFNLPAINHAQEIAIGETISVADLAHKMSIKAAEVIKALMKLGTMVTINQVLDQETAAIVVEEMGHTYKFVSENLLEDELLHGFTTSDIKASTRPPVVTIMGHVDHGKTSLLDYIRHAHVVKGEAGGITQHIGAYHVKTEKGVISFLDTPGHSAFTAMRARGAKVTDIVILVIAADDGIMPQTIEGIQHARAAGVPIIVAVTKIDKPTADKERILSELTQYEIVSEEWGGENLFSYVSSKTGEGIDHLLDQILVQSEILELTAIAEGPARGAVVESRLDRGRGTVATVLVQSGLLKKGDILLAGYEYGRIRALIDENGNQVETAGPSIPVEVLGLSGVPNAGDEITVVADERKAREIALFRQGKFREIKLARQHKSKLENLFTNISEGELKAVNVVLKADVQGSVEALTNALEELSNDEVSVKVVSSGVGGINESDANLAVASNAIVIGFNVRADNSAKKIIEDEGLGLHYYSIIYEVIDEIKTALIGKLAPEFKEEIIGTAEVRDVFKSPKIGAIAGCMVIDGVIKRNNPIRVLRDNVVIYEGALESLRRFKDDVNEVRNGMECGIGVKNYNDVRAGDQIEVYERVQVARTL